MKKIMIPFIILLILSAGSIYFFAHKKTNSNGVDTLSNNPADKRINTPKPKSFPVNRLPVFAAQDCNDRGGVVEKVTQKGQTLEKCVFHDK